MPKDTVSIVYLAIGIILFIFGLEQYLANIFFNLPFVIGGMFDWIITLILIIIGLYWIYKGFMDIKSV
jgi:hypothetical protein